MDNRVIPDSNDIDRLFSLQNSDRGFFVLALYSFIEGYLRSRYSSSYAEASFGELAGKIRDELKQARHLSRQELNCLSTLASGRASANKVRHEYGQLSGEEVIASVFRFKQFAQLNNFYATGKLSRLDDSLESWKTRKSNNELSDELDRAAAQIRELTQSNSKLSVEVSEFSVLKEQLTHFEKKNAVIECELLELKNRTRMKDEQNDTLRKEKFAEQENVRKEIHSLRNKIGELSDARTFLDALSRITVYTRTRLDFEQSLIRLTTEQKKIVDQIHLRKDFLIKGSAGTGKSLVLIKALEKALSRSGESLGLHDAETVALLTYTKSLVAYTSYVSSLLDMPLPATCISTVDRFYQTRFKSLVGDCEIVYKGDSLLESFTEPEGNFITAKELFQEAESFIWANAVTREEYVEKTIARTGMKKPLKATERFLVWVAVEKAEARLKGSGIWTRSLAALHLVQNAHLIPDSDKVDCIFIDEVQDLPAVILSAIKKCSRRSLVLAGDADQSIYQNGFSWKRAGIDIGGRTRILHTNFRNTTTLHEFADKYRSTIPGMDSDNSSDAFRIGAPPECSAGATIDDLYEMILQKVNVCLKYLSYDPENICIIAPKHDHLLRLADELKGRYGIASAVVNEDGFSFAERGVIRLSTMHSSKGLDFPVVLFLLDHRPLFQGAYDDATQDRMVRNLIYVSITRAMEHLHVFTLSGATAGAIVDLVGQGR